MNYILTIESFGMHWSATLYGPGLPVIRPGRGGELIRLDIVRTLRRMIERDLAQRQPP